MKKPASFHTATRVTTAQTLPDLAGVVSAQTLAQWLDPAGYTGLSADLAHQAAGASTA